MVIESDRYGFALSWATAAKDKYNTAEDSTVMARLLSQNNVKATLSLQPYHGDNAMATLS